MDRRITKSVERAVRPLSAFEATLLSAKLSPEYAVVYVGRLSYKSWKAVAQVANLSTSSTKRMFREAHTDLVKYADWQRKAA
jgi:AraC-like DNA-binding protein